MAKFIGYVMGALVLSFVIGILFVYSCFSYGVLFYRFYNWFVLPVFTDLPNITFYMAIGLSTFTSLFKNTSPGSLKDELYKDEPTKRAATLLLTPWITLLFGYLIKIIFIN